MNYRTKTFSCSVCGSEASFCLAEPTKNSECTTIGWTSAKPLIATPRLQSASQNHRGGGHRLKAAICPVVRFLEGARRANRWIGHGWLVRPTIELDGCCYLKLDLGIPKSVTSLQTDRFHVFECKPLQIISVEFDHIGIAENELPGISLQQLLRDRAALAGDIAHSASLRHPLDLV